MTAAFARTGVACVQGAVIVNLDQFGLERIDKPFVDAGNDCLRHGRTFLNGRTEVRAKTPSRTYASSASHFSALA